MVKRAEKTLFYTSFESEESLLPVCIPVNERCRNMRLFKTEPGKGPSEVWNNLPNVGWSGKRALKVNGIHSGEGSACGLNILFNNIHLTVRENTALSYLIFPVLAKGKNYDKQDTAMHVSVDLRFDDGSFLHDLKIKDINGSVLTPLGQGESRTLYANQWNAVRADLSAARGKTITQILIGYEMNKNEGGLDLEFTAYIDDLHIFNKSAEEVHDVLDYVSILRGTNDSGKFSRGLTVPAVAVPFGFNLWCPVNTDKADELYKFQPNGEYRKLRHITVSHEPSKWIGDRGTWQFMVNTSININSVNKPSKISAEKRAAEFSHNDEIAKPDMYRVIFKNGAAAGSALELTPTSHAAAVQFFFSPDTKHRNIIFDSVNAPGKIVIGSDNRSFSAYTDHVSGGMKRMYVYGTFDAPIKKYKIFGKQAVLNFGSSKNIEMRVATSFISPSQAKRNLMLETSGRSYITLRTAAHNKWLDKLSRVEIEGAEREQLVTFYSCMYRLFLYPNLLSENTGTKDNPRWRYASPYNKREILGGKLYYNNGFWDTYRTVWSAYSLLSPVEEAELLTGIVEHCNAQGWIPRWTAPGGRNCMVGTDSDTIFAEAMVKNIRFPKEKAYESALKNGGVFPENPANGGRIGVEQSVFKGYTSSDIKEGLSWSTEGYINDFAVARMADLLGDADNAAYYRNRSLQYTELFSRFKGGWFRGKTYDKTRRSRLLNNLDTINQLSAAAYWEVYGRGYNFKILHNKKRADGLYKAANKLCDILPGMDKTRKNSVPSVPDGEFDPHVWGGDYTETNGWNAAFSAPHDGQGLVNLYGGAKQFTKKLDEFFAADRTDFKAGSYKRAIHEMLEAREIRLGQYNHGNQPSHHIPYMYNYAGRPDRTAEIVRDILRRCYVGSSIGQGYCGDEDNGEMSAWYILSALGLYPLSPASGCYAVGSPLFKKAIIHLENGGDITLAAPNNSDKNIYVRSLRVNGQTVSRSYLRHSEITNGGIIEFEMSEEPSNWGGTLYDRAPSITTSDEPPRPVKDLTSPNTATLSEPPTTRTAGNAAYCAGQKISSLFDDHSASYAALPLKNGKVSLYYHFEKPVTLQMYTLTSSNNKEAAPIRAVLYGFNGREWVPLDRRNSLYFKWERFTRPFLIPPERRGSYSCYRLDMDGAEDFIELAEIEFLGT